MIDQAKRIFTKQFHQAPEITVYAPGRVNLIGEHTDYNDGFVMPCAINFGTAISGKPRQDHQWRVFASDLNEWDEFSLTEPIEPNADKKWTGYVRGMVKMIQARYPNFSQGADLVISGNVPLSSGLSSSAALEVAVGIFCKNLAQLPLSQTDIALLGQKAENQFVGCQCGNMDQLISALGEKDHCLMIDCRTLDTAAVPLPKNLAVVIINSNVKHDLVAGEYNSRRQQCEKAADFFNVAALRDVTLHDFAAKAQALAALDPLAAKRAKHVITENARVLAAKTALEQQNIAQLSQLMAASHQSMRDDFEITIPEIDYLVELVDSVIGKQGGVRMTGGGFGGCVVALVPQALVEPVRQVVSQNYQKKTGLTETFYLCTASDGGRVC